MEKTKILIVGAGPGGTAAALQLAKLNQACVLVDRAKFPRDKICGDGIGNKTVALLDELDPGITEQLEQKNIAKEVKGFRFIIAQNNLTLDVPFFDEESTEEEYPTYVSTRYDFDNFLVEEAKKNELIDFREEINITSIEKDTLGFLVQNKAGSFKMHCNLLLMANGAQSQFTRKYVGIKKDLKHQAAAIRAYYKNVKGLHPEGYIEVFQIKKILPGYLWIFPLPDNKVNIGLGMRSDVLVKDKKNLRKMLNKVLETNSLLKNRFKDAYLIGDIKGFPLPFGSKQYPLSGDHFMLIGDAGHLINPLSGEGISTAIQSGMIAAQHAVRCFDENKFSDKFMKQYDEEVDQKIRNEMKTAYLLQRIFSFTWLPNKMADLLGRSQKMQAIVSQIFVNPKKARQLLNPIFWIRVIFEKKITR